MTGASDGEDEADREWRFSLDEVGPDADADGGESDGATGEWGGGDADAPTDGADADATEEGEHGEDGGEGALGTFSPSKTIEPESIDLENALFVVLGVVLSIAFFWYLFP